MKKRLTILALAVALLPALTHADSPLPPLPPQLAGRHVILVPGHLISAGGMVLYPDGMRPDTCSAGNRSPYWGFTAGGATVYIQNNYHVNSDCSRYGLSLQKWETAGVQMWSAGGGLYSDFMYTSSSSSLAGPSCGAIPFVSPTNPNPLTEGYDGHVFPSSQGNLAVLAEWETQSGCGQGTVYSAAELLGY